MNPPNPYPVPPQAQPPPLGRKDQFFQSPWGIILLTVTVAGPLTIPLVWKSTQMNRNTKWAFTIAISVFSIFVLYLGWVVVKYTLYAMNELQAATQIY